MRKREVFIGLAVFGAIAVAVPAMGGGLDATSSLSVGKLNKKLKKLTERVAAVEETDPVAGPQGQQGPRGSQGPPGSPDTPAQVLSKLAQVDGPDSGLDADTLDGTTANDFGLVDGANLGMSTGAAATAYLAVPSVGELVADCDPGPTATLVYRNPDINSQGVVTHHHEAATPFTQDDLAGGATTSPVSVAGAAAEGRVTYRTSAGQWDVFVSTPPAGGFCFFQGHVIR
jgi:hypothetical protein